MVSPVDPMIGRRQLITGLISFVAAPAVIRVADLMPIKRITEIEREVGVVDWGEIVRITMHNKSEVLANVITENNALLQRLRGERWTYLTPRS